MPKILILLVLIFTGGFSFAKSSPKGIAYKAKTFFKKLLHEVPDEKQEKEEDEMEVEELSFEEEDKSEEDTPPLVLENTPPSLLESLNNSEKQKSNIQRELAKKLTDENTDDTKESKKDSINFGDVDLKISKRPEEILIQNEDAKDDDKINSDRKPTSKD